MQRLGRDIKRKFSIKSCKGQFYKSFYQPTSIIFHPSLKFMNRTREEHLQCSTIAYVLSLTLTHNKFTSESFVRVKHSSLLYQIVLQFAQGILKGEVSLFHWPPVWLVWNQLYDNWNFLILFAKQTTPNQWNRRSMVQWYFPLVFPDLLDI
jgi:hypothetical protein